MLKFITTVSSTASIRLFTFLHGKKIGTDSLGNIYYSGKPRGQNKRDRRWVMYKDKADASLVPPEWHGWLHHQTNIIPQEENNLRQAWQKPPLSNQTGTSNAYHPPSHATKDGVRDQATGDYQAWSPSQN